MPNTEGVSWGAWIFWVVMAFIVGGLIYVVYHERNDSIYPPTQTQLTSYELCKDDCKSVYKYEFEEQEWFNCTLRLDACLERALSSISCKNHTSYIPCDERKVRCYDDQDRCQDHISDTVDLRLKEKCMNICGGAS